MLGLPEPQHNGEVPIGGGQSVTGEFVYSRLMY